MVGSSVRISVGIGYGKLEGYPLGWNLFGSEYRTKVGTYFGRSDGKIGYYVGSSEEEFSSVPL